MRLATAAMGTRFEIVIADEGSERFRAAGEAAIEAVEACHRRFSRFAPDSLVAHLARIPAGTRVRLDRETSDLFLDALAVWSGSEGAFDVTAPANAMDAIRLDPARQTIALDRSGVLLDLGGIAKGHALDVAAAILRDAGVESAFLHGGTSSAIGLGPNGWRVALSNEAGGEVVTLQDRALAVSRTGHDTPHPTLDPRTGDVVVEWRAIAVLGPTARRCDAWATAGAVLGERPPGMGHGLEMIFLTAPLPLRPSARP